MEALIKEEVNKLLDIGKENGGLQTSTIVQLLNDLGKMSDDIYIKVLEEVEAAIIIIAIMDIVMKVCQKI